MSTFPDLLARRLAREPGRPFVTYYDETSGERTELSVTTYANWVAKNANLLVDELMLDPGDVLTIDLPPHWLGAVLVGAAWSAGVEPTKESGGTAVVVGPPGERQVTDTLACSLTPFATPFTTPLPEGVHDHGLLWPGQSDVFAAVEPVELTVTACDDRVLTDLDPAGPEGRQLLADVLAGDGSLVLLRDAAHAQWPARAENERATATRRG